MSAPHDGRSPFGRLLGFDPERGEITVDLRSALGSKLPMVQDWRQVELWLTDPAPLWLDREQLLALIDDWRPKAARASHNTTVLKAMRAAVEWLRDLAVRGETVVRYNCSNREEHGGRRMFWYVPGYTDRIVMSGKGMEKARNGPHFQLQAIPKALRPGLFAAPGNLFVDIDISACHPAVAAALSGDPQLVADVAGDVHQISGDRLFEIAKGPSGRGDVPARFRRKVGKIINSLILCGGDWLALRDEALSLGASVDNDRAVAVYNEWWARYPLLRELRDGWWDRTGRKGGLTVVKPDGTPYRLSQAEITGGKTVYVGGLDDSDDRRVRAFRSTISSFWRAVESAIMDRVLAFLYELRPRGVRVVVPMYDGVLVEVPEVGADKITTEIIGLVERAAAEAGVAVRAEATVGRSWPA